MAGSRFSIPHTNSIRNRSKSAHKRATGSKQRERYSLDHLHSMLQSVLAPHHQQQQQGQVQPQPQPSTSTSNDGIFWSPTPPNSVQPTSILQRPPQPQQQQQSLQPVFMNTPGTLNMVPGGAADFAGDYSQIFEWVSQLLKGPEGREKALLELSKKREQYEDLALILWHSFGTGPFLVDPCVLTYARCYVNVIAGNYQCLSALEPSGTHSSRIEPCV